MKKELKMPPNEFYQEGMALLKKHKLLVVAIKVLPKYLLTHKENRNRLMLNALQVHYKGAVILKIGADREQLSTAVCVELAPAGPTRVANLSANASLISKSNGLLAPINGEEKYLTLGCGHTGAFCKVAPLGGPTPEKDLQNESGTLDYSVICKQSEYKAMCEEGWDWTVIPWDVDAQFPRFASAVQKALNGSNSASQEIGELDTAVHFADLMQAVGDEPEWEKGALKSAKDSCMACASYANVLMDFCKLYGGGAGAPHICFIDSIYKGFNSKMLLGETFWRAITYSEFYDKSSCHPLLRVAFAICNLTTDKHENNVAKFLLKVDVQKAIQKAQAGKALEAEGILKNGMEIVQLLQNELKEDAATQALGQLFVRVGLYVVDKSKQGPDAMELNLDQIKGKFLASLGKHVGKPVNFDKWGVTAAAGQTASAGLPASKDVPGAAAKAITLSDLNSDTWKCEQKGFVVGSYCKERITPNQSGTKDARSSLMQITSICDATSTVHLKQPIQFNPEITQFEGSVKVVSI